MLNTFPLSMVCFFFSSNNWFKRAKMLCSKLYKFEEALQGAVHLARSRCYHLDFSDASLLDDPAEIECFCLTSPPVRQKHQPWSWPCTNLSFVKSRFRASTPWAFRIHSHAMEKNVSKPNASRMITEDQCEQVFLQPNAFFFCALYLGL